MNRKFLTGMCLGVAGIVAVIAGGFAPLGQPDKKPVPAAPPAQPAKPDAHAPATPPAKQPEKKPDAAPDAGDMDEMMMPGAPHKQLAKMVGDWDTMMTFSMGGQAMPGSKGTAKISAMLGDRFFKEDATGEMMGQPYTSFKTIGYNNGTKKYEGMWLYTMSTAMMTLTGSSTDDGKTITLAATVAESADKKEEMTIVMKWIDENTFTVTLTSKGDAAGPDASLETKYTRKK